MNTTPSPQILPVVFGYDIAAYSFARLFHEAIGVRSLVVAEAHRGPINDSRIFDVRPVAKGTGEDETAFLDVLDAIAREHRDRRLVLLVNTDEAVEFVARNRSRLEDDWFLPYGSPEAVATANSKAAMGDVVASVGLAAPARTRIDMRSPDTWRQALKDVRFPVVVKPERGSDLGAYWNQGLRKVLAVPTRTQAYETFDRWRQDGVRAPLVVQELIPGDDTAQWVVNGYVDSHGRVTACGSGRVLLGLHQPEYLGNAGIILTQREPELLDQAERIVSAVGLRGFFSMDVKVDPRDGVPRWLDLNPRIGRGHYYLKVAGVDLASAMLADMEGREIPYQTNVREGVFCIIPVGLAGRRYVRDAELRERVRRAKRVAVVNPLAYAKDRHIKRTLYRLANGVNQWRRMRAWYPRPTDSGF